MSVLKISIRFLVLLALMVSFPFRDASAGSRTKAPEVRQNLRLIAQKVKKLEAELRGMSSAERSKVLAAFPRSLGDSDGDGLPDIVEQANNSNACVDDSDSDGSDDSTEFEDGTSPSDATELEVTGTISGLSGSSFTVATKAVSVNSSTAYKHGDSSDLADGACVEVKIDATDPSALIATRIDFKKSDDCA